tara:strand:+ start:1009 stop:1302 length:294 start_codon:yes stop_codon:yes gene_type:complete
LLLRYNVNIKYKNTLVNACVIATPSKPNCFEAINEKIMFKVRKNEAKIVTVFSFPRRNSIMSEGPNKLVIPCPKNKIIIGQKALWNPSPYKNNILWP